MITQTGYNKIEFKFGCEILLDNLLNNDDDYGLYYRFLLVLISENLNADTNILDSLNPNNNIYESEQANYIRRYQKFSKFVKENKGKQFIAIIPSFVGYNYRKVGILNISNIDFSFDRAMRSRGSSDISFLTDYELIPVESNGSIIKLKKILESIIISRANKPLLEEDYRGRSVL